MFKKIVMSREEFEIQSFNKEDLAFIGALFFMRFIGYRNISSIIKILDHEPGQIQRQVESVCKKYQKKLIYYHRITHTADQLDIFLVKNVFSLHKEYTLYINVDQKDFLRAKKILYALSDRSMKKL